MRKTVAFLIYLCYNHACDTAKRLVIHSFFTEKIIMKKTVYFAGGCFWGVQRFFDQFAGVEKTETGYANGGGGEVSYEQVCASSGHAETVRIEFDDEKISIAKLLG